MGGLMLHALAAAAAETPGFDILPLIERFGLPLIFLALVISGQLVRKGEYDQMREDRNAQRDALAALQATVTTDIVPALTRSTDAVTRANAINEARRLVGVTDVAIPWLRRQHRETTPAKTTEQDVAQTIDRLRFLATRLDEEVQKFEQSAERGEQDALRRGPA